MSNYFGINIKKHEFKINKISGLISKIENNPNRTHLDNIQLYAYKNILRILLQSNIR